MKKLLIILFLSFHHFFIFAVVEDSKLTTFEYTKKIKEKLDGLKDLEAKVYFSDIDKFRIEIEQFLDHKTRVCRGEFSTIILKENKEIKKTKLSKEEKKLCFKELKAIYITYLNHMYVARKNYMDYEHEKRLNELLVIRDKAILELGKKSFFYSKR